MVITWLLWLWLSLSTDYVTVARWPFFPGLEHVNVVNPPRRGDVYRKVNNGFAYINNMMWWDSSHPPLPWHAAVNIFPVQWACFHIIIFKCPKLGVSTSSGYEYLARKWKETVRQISSIAVEIVCHLCKLLNQANLSIPIFYALWSVNISQHILPPSCHLCHLKNLYCFATFHRYMVCTDCSRFDQVPHQKNETFI